MTRSCLSLTVIAAVAGVWLMSPSQAAGQSPAERYQDALARERDLRQPGARPAAGEFRDLIAAYESIVVAFPASDYEDRALWQAAGLAVEAYDRYRDDLDLEVGIRLLRRLARFHHGSPFAARVTERRSQLEALTRFARLTAIDREVWDDVVRVLIRLDRDVPFQSERLADPDRLFFDFPHTDALAGLRDATLTFDDGHRGVHGIRLGRHPNRTTRVVIDTADADACSIFTVYEPYRVVVDCRRPEFRRAVPAVPLQPALAGLMQAPRSPLHGVAGALREDRSAAAPAPARAAAATAADPESAWPTPLPGETGAFSLARQLGLQVSRIVIDPGHGGHDPGARGHGLRESEVVLDIAHRLERRLLTQPGIEVVLTRRDNTYIPLRERTALANRVQADLFLSIHANASHKSHARGIETYFLNFAPDPNAERIAARENVAGGGTMNNLGDLLETIASNSKANESRDFAGVIQQAMVAALRQADPDIPDLGVKQAPFIVLIGARMPSVLAEVSFLSNSREARLLSTDDYRDRIADALFEGILRYRNRLQPVARLAQED